MKTIIQQDDCSPDSLYTFDKKFVHEVGESRITFIETAERIEEADDGYFIRYIKGEYALSISADDPYWKLCLKEYTGIKTRDNKKIYVGDKVDTVQGTIFTVVKLEHISGIKYALHDGKRSYDLEPFMSPNLWLVACS